jgi:hypothetical protein
VRDKNNHGLKMKITTDRFFWHSFDIKKELESQAGSDWADRIKEFAMAKQKRKPILPRSVTSRESSKDEIIDTAIVDGITIRHGLPWLYNLGSSRLSVGDF